MAQYGELLVDTNPQIDLLYGYFDRYFNYPQMIKIKNVDGKSMYICRIKCTIVNTNRYIIVFSPHDPSPVGTRVALGQLQWFTLHTSTLKEDHNIPQHVYVPSRNTPLNVTIERTKTTSDGSTYECQSFPLSIFLVSKTFSENEYNATGNIINALETYSTIVTIDELPGDDY